MRFVLVFATIVNLASCAANLGMVWSTHRTQVAIEDVAKDVRDSWQANNSYLQRLGVALGQIERDIIRIRSKKR